MNQEFEDWWTRHESQLEEMQGTHLVDLVGLKKAAQLIWNAAYHAGYFSGYDVGSLETADYYSGE